MQKAKNYKRLGVILLLICLAQAFYIYLSRPASPEPTRVVSITAINDQAAIYEVLYDSGGATVPFIYRYFVVGPKDKGDDVLASIENIKPFLVTKGTGAVVEAINNRVKLQTIDSIYEFSNVGFYLLNEDLKLVKFDLNSISP